MLILASKSPRRAELLSKIGLQYRVLSADADETMDPLLPIEGEICRVSEKKARAVAPLVSPEDVILAADTMVCVDGKRLGKPATPAAAAQMLQMLSGRSHSVVTGLCLLQGDQCETAAVTTKLQMRPISPEEIAAYVATGEPMDKAGAYGIQGLASIFVESMEGDYYNVMGLPLCQLSRMLPAFGIQVL